MNPLIFQYLEVPLAQSQDFSLVEYSEVKNLSVIKGTSIPAVQSISCDTVTHTRASIEGTDSDIDSATRLALLQLLDTQTVTLVKTEDSDSDNNYTCLRSLLDTQTLTEAKEVTDSDR